MQIRKVLTSSLALTLLLGCSDPAVQVAPPESASTIGGVLENSWMGAVVAEPAVLDRLLSAEGGEGWLALYRGDLEQADKSFSAALAEGGPPANDAARLGRARVHLARADALRTAAALQEQSTLEVFLYRRTHRSSVRTGELEPLLAWRAAQRAGASPELLSALELESQGARGTSTRPEVASGLRALASKPGSIPEGLPDLFRRRLEFAAAVDRGALGEAERLLPLLEPATPDLVDLLGVDPDSGLRFELSYYDSSFTRALVRFHLGMAYRQAGLSESGPWAEVAKAVKAAWGGELPPGSGLGVCCVEDSSGLPAWTALFAGPVIDPADWSAYWREDHAGLLQRADEAFPDLQLREARSAAEIDAALRQLEAARPAITSFFEERGDEAGDALVAELDLVTLVVDRLLRARIVTLTADGGAVQATRLGHRAIDPRPGSDTGPANAARTRVCYRNDRASLLRYAESLWRAGQPGAALEIVHPLAEEDSALQSLKESLVQIDAASSVGSGGKANQR
ncbi:MAG: hypothetical protein VX498_05930 [Myxococcota bacterium]|nr:hypothetical protein [Myxococcota bacterium]